MTPLLYRWDGEAMRPLRLDAKRASEYFQAGKTYQLAELHGRSVASHRQFFAAVNDAWANLPEEIADEFPSPDELRKWALTYTPFRITREYRASSRQEAMRIAKYMREGEEYCRIEFDNGGKLVRKIIPRSQSFAEMSNREFQQSKDAVLDILARKLGISTDDLRENAGRSA